MSSTKKTPQHSVPIFSSPEADAAVAVVVVAAAVADAETAAAVAVEVAEDAAAVEAVEDAAAFGPGAAGVAWCVQDVQ